jgi:hypothetical protein
MEAPPMPRMEDKTGKEAAVAELVLHDDEEMEEEEEKELDNECRCVRPLVVGIAGASRSGKTTLALGLLGALGGPTPAPNSTTSLFESFAPRTIVHLDRYFKSVPAFSINSFTSLYFFLIKIIIIMICIYLITYYCYSYINLLCDIYLKMKMK